jgi:hypothetical protein
VCVTLIVYELSPHDARRWPRASQVRHPLCILIHHSNPLVFLRRSRRARFATSNFGIWSPAESAPPVRIGVSPSRCYTPKDPSLIWTPFAAGGAVPRREAVVAVLDSLPARLQSQNSEIRSSRLCFAPRVTSRIVLRERAGGFDRRYVDFDSVATGTAPPMITGIWGWLHWNHGMLFAWHCAMQ